MTAHARHATRRDGGTRITAEVCASPSGAADAATPGGGPTLDFPVGDKSGTNGTGTDTATLTPAGVAHPPGEVPGAAIVLGSRATGELISPDTVRRLACDAGIIPVVLGRRGETLNQGAMQRLFTTAQVRALWRRDRHCTFPDCGIPAAWCDAHHLTHWIDGGLTDLANAALLCARHHTIVHRDQLAGRVTHARAKPDGVLPDNRRRTPSSRATSRKGGGGSPAQCGASGIHGRHDPVTWELRPGS
jgi:hypothetical protein